MMIEHNDDDDYDVSDVDNDDDDDEDDNDYQQSWYKFHLTTLCWRSS